MFPFQTSQKMKNTQEVIRSYETFIEEKLKGDLKEIERLLSTKVSLHKDWQELRNFVEHIQSRSSDDDEIVTNFPIGCDVQMLARLNNFETLLVKIGCDCYLEMYYPEALKYAELTMKKLLTEMEFLRGQAAKVKANIKLSLLAMHGLQEQSQK